MLARCTLCEKTFVTNQFGRQICPKCGREVFIADPREPEGSENPYAAPHAATNQYAGVEAYSEAKGVPWDHRQELGLWRALTETMKLALTEPAAFFSQVRADRTDGLHFYFFLVAIVPAWISAIIGRLISNPAEQIEKMITMYRQMGQEDAARMMEKVQAWAGTSVSIGSFLLTLLFTPVFYFAGLYFFAGVSHLVLRLMGKGETGWNGTFASFVYAFSPGITNIVPGCGWLIMGTWVTALQIIGLGKVQRVTAGISSIAVLSFHALFACCACGMGAAIIAAFGSTLGQFGPSN